MPFCPATDSRGHGRAGDVQRTGGRGDNRLLSRQDKARPQDLQVPGVDSSPDCQGQLGEAGVYSRRVQGERRSRAPDLPLRRDDPHQHGPLDLAHEG